MTVIMNKNKGKNTGEKPLLPLKIDYVFKSIIGDRDNPDILADFLSAALDMAVEEFSDLKITDPSLQRRHEGDKLAILDVLIYTKDGKMIDIEIQRQNVDALAERIAFMNARMLAGQLQIGEKYGILKKAVSIVISDFVMIREDDLYHHRFLLHDPAAGVTFTDVMQVDLLELPKLPLKRDASKLYDWLMVIDKVEEKEMEQEIEQIMEENPMIKKAVMKLREMSEDEVEREIAFRRMIALADEMGRRDYALKEGREMGRDEERRESAMRMKADGLDPTLIAKYTGLSAEEIAKL